MSDGPLDFINTLTAQLVTALQDLPEDVKVVLKAGETHAIALGEDEQNIFGRFGIAPGRLDWVYVNHEQREELTELFETISDEDKKGFEQEFFRYINEILTNLGFDTTINTSMICLLIEPSPINDALFVVQTPYAFNPDEIDPDTLEETVRKIISIHVIGWSFLTDILRDEDENEDIELLN